MNTEQLKMILEAFGNASSGAYIVAILWILRVYFGILIGASVIVYGIRTLAEFYKREQVLNEMAKAAKMGSFPDYEELIKIFKHGLEHK